MGRLAEMQRKLLEVGYRAYYITASGLLALSK